MSPSKISFVIQFIILVMLIRGISVSTISKTPKPLRTVRDEGVFDFIGNIVGNIAKKNKELENKLMKLTPAPRSKNFATAVRSEIRLQANDAPPEYTAPKIAPPNNQLSTLKLNASSHNASAVNKFFEDTMRAMTDVVYSIGSYLSSGHGIHNKTNGSALRPRQARPGPGGIWGLGPIPKAPPVNDVGTDIELQCYKCEFENLDCVDMNATIEKFSNDSRYKVKCNDIDEEPARFCTKIKMKNGRVKRGCIRELPLGYKEGCQPTKHEFFGRYYPVEFCLCKNTPAQNKDLPCNTGTLPMTNSPNYYVLPFLLTCILAAI